MKITIHAQYTREIEDEAELDKLEANAYELAFQELCEAGECGIDGFAITIKKEQD